MNGIVIVGASLAGLRAAEAFRANGFDGRLLLIGDEPHPPYSRPPLSKQLLAGTMTASDCAFELDDLDAEWMLGVEATGLDLDRREVILDARERCAFDGLLIATGCSARSWPGVRLPPSRDVYFLRKLDDALGLAAAAQTARRVVILGGGFIGCEAAAALREIGREVAIVDIAPYPMTALGAELGAVCAELHAEHGVALHLGVTAESFEVHGDRINAVRLTNGTRLAADLLLVATGAQPNTTWLRDSGLTLDPGVVCDPTCRAIGAEAIFCAGDVASVPSFLVGGEPLRVEHWTNAAEQAVLAAANMLTPEGDRMPYEGVPYFWSDQYGIKIQSAGLPSAADRRFLLEGTVEARKFIIGFARGPYLIGVVGFGLPRHMPLYRRQIAAQARVEELVPS